MDLRVQDPDKVALVPNIRLKGSYHLGSHVQMQEHGNSDPRITDMIRASCC
jgi:hypothetical protein